MRSFLPYGRHTIEEEDIKAVLEVLRGDWLTTGPQVDAFESALADRVGAKYAVSCSSGTAALHLAALTLGLNPGDWAVVPAITFVATANAVRITGAEVLFADVDPDTGLMRPQDVAAVIEENRDKTIKAILPVHLNGQCCDLVGIADIACSHNSTVVDDCCHALGTAVNDNSSHWFLGSGPLRSMSVFSFHPVKAVTTGEGGAITTDDAGLAATLKKLRSHGVTRSPSDFVNQELAFDIEGTANPWYYEQHELGVNYRITDFQCALGLSQLRKLDQFVTARRKLVETYDQLLEGFAPLVRPIGRVPGCVPSWHLYPVHIDFPGIGMSRAQLMHIMQQEGIGTQVHYLPVPWQPYYFRRYGSRPFPGASSYYHSVLSLPLYPRMDLSDQLKVVEVLRKYLCR